MLKKILVFTCLFPLISFGQGLLQFEPDRNIPPSEQYPEKNPSNDPQREVIEETPTQQIQRIQTRFGDSKAAIVLVEDAERNWKELPVEQIREKLIQAKDELEKVKSTRISEKEKKQLAKAWGRLAKSERFLFGDTLKNLEWLRRASELDPDNADVARALGVAERKHKIAQQRLELAAQIRAGRNQQH